MTNGLRRTPLLHLTPGLDGVSRAVNEADRGLLPAEATIALGQPMAVDPSRAPDGSWVIWVQLQELPPRPKGDAAGELDTGDGSWTEELREAYADRIVASASTRWADRRDASAGPVAVSHLRAALRAVRCSAARAVPRSVLVLTRPAPADLRRS